MGLHFKDDTDDMGLHAWQKPGLLFVVVGIVFLMPAGTIITKTDWDPQQWQVSPIVIGGMLLGLSFGLISCGVCTCVLLYRDQNIRQVKRKPRRSSRCLCCFSGAKEATNNHYKYQTQASRDCEQGTSHQSGAEPTRQEPPQPRRPSLVTEAVLNEALWVATSPVKTPWVGPGIDNLAFGGESSNWATDWSLQVEGAVGRGIEEEDDGESSGGGESEASMPPDISPRYFPRKQTWH